MTSKLVVNTIEADTGISSVSFASSISLSSTSKFHFSAAGIDIDADTNINRPAAGVLAFNINSSEKVRIDSSGYLIAKADIRLRRTASDNGALYFGDSNNNYIFGSDADDVITLATAGSERLRIDSSGRMLIGTTTAGEASADELTVANSGHAGMTIRSGTSSWGSFFFSDGTSGGAQYDGAIEYKHSDNYMRFRTAQTERLRISSAGMVLIGETSVAGGSQKLVIGNGGAENMEFTPGTSAQNGGVLEYIHRGDTSTRPDLSMYVGGGAFKVYTGGNNQRLKITDNGLFLFLTDDAGYAASYTNMVIGNNSASNSGITIASSTSGIGRIHFADNNTGNAVFAGWIAYNHSSNKMMFSTNESGSEKVTITSGGKVKMVSATANQRGLSVVAPGTQINFGATEDKGGFLLSTTDGQFSLSGGGYWGGSNWVATATASTQIRHDGGTGPMKFCFNTGLTAGNNFTPTTRFEITPSGDMRQGEAGVTMSDSNPYFSNAWSSTDGYNKCFTIASSKYATLRMKGEQGSNAEFTQGTGDGTFYMCYDENQNAHRITCPANGVLTGNFSGSSDEKMKKNITSLADNAITRIKQLRPVNFDWKRESDLNGQSGFIAQEVKTVIPDLVSGEEYDETQWNSIGYSINYDGMIAHLTKALQEAITEIETLKTKVAALEGS